MVKLKTPKMNAQNLVPDFQGIYGQPSDLQILRTNPTNVRNLEEDYKLVVEKTEVGSGRTGEGEEVAPIYQYTIRTVAEESSPIAQLFFSLFNPTTNEFIVTTPITVAPHPTESGNYVVISGNSRITFAKQLQAFVESGEYPYPIKFCIPYVLYKYDERGLAVAQIRDNTSVALPAWGKFDAICLMVDGALSGEEAFNAFKEAAFQVLGVQNRSMVFNLAKAFKAFKLGLPETEVKAKVNNPEMMPAILKVYQDAHKKESLDELLQDEIAPSTIIDDISTVAPEKPFTRAMLNDLKHLVKERTEPFTPVETVTDVPKPDAGTASPAVEAPAILTEGEIDSLFDSIKDSYDILTPLKGEMVELADDQRIQLAMLLKSIDASLTKAVAIFYPPAK